MLLLTDEYIILFKPYYCPGLTSLQSFNKVLATARQRCTANQLVSTSTFMDSFPRKIEISDCN